MDKRFRIPLKESYLLIIIIVGILSLCMYSSFALFSLEKTTSKDIFTMKAASDIETTLKIFEYKKITVSAGDNTSVMVNVNNDTGGSIYYGVFYEMVSPSTKTDDIGIYKIDWSANATSGSITNGSKLPVEIIIINNSSSDITLNIGVAGSDSNELGLPDGKTLITETFNTGTEPSGDEGTTKTTTTDYSYTGAVQTATLKAGTHKLEVWGAEGGNGANSSSGFDSSSGALGGKGGYSYGTLTLSETTKAYIYIGGAGEKITSSITTGGKGGFNGGGSGGVSGSMSRSGGGGGASDIRLGTDSLYARVIVAGGGGSTTWGPSSESAGYGGGTTGGTGQGTSGGTGGSQTLGGKNGNAGSFGQGGNAIASSSSTNISGAGGGGWYGGGSGIGSNTSGNKAHGGGGSGYVYTSETSSSYPSGCLLNSKYYLTNASTIGGNTSFTDNSGSTVTGHSGNGYARITSTVKTSTIPSVKFNVDALSSSSIINLKDVSVCNDNGSGCNIILIKPSNTSNMKKNSTNEVIYILADNNGKRYKYVKKIYYGNILNGWASNAVQQASDNTTGDNGSGIYKVSHNTIASGSSATGSEIKSSTDYRYYGVTPNNYICLDNSSNPCEDRHLYRIIGSIYDEVDRVNKLKVIKATVLTDGNTNKFSWNYMSNGTYNNNWATATNGNYSNSLTSGASLMQLLNSGLWWNRTSGSYYNNSTTSTLLDFNSTGLSTKAQKLVSVSRYYLGGYNSSEITPTDIYYKERGAEKASSNTLYWDGKVGLMYPSDYGFASGSKCSQNITLNKYNETCANINWLFLNNNTWEWFLTHNSSDTNYAFSIYSNGLVYNYASTVNPNSVRPVFYLSSNAYISKGIGTIDNPYQVIWEDVPDQN